LSDDIDLVKELEDEGAAAIVLRSLYEEEIKGEQIAAFLHSESHGDSSAEAGSYFPDPESALGPEEYLEHLRRVKDAVDMRFSPLNGARLAGGFLVPSGKAGADALELNIYHAASDPTTSAAEG
jgi:dihydroorotate dehydrogenase (fumarate)